MKLLFTLLAIILLPNILLAVMTTPNIDPSKVRYGNYSTFDATKNHLVGVVDSVKVYSEIPAYKTIKKEKLEKGTARYTQLMFECTKQFRASLSKVATSGKYKLIVEVGGVSGYPSTNVMGLAVKYLNG